MQVIIITFLKIIYLFSVSWPADKREVLFRIHGRGVSILVPPTVSTNTTCACLDYSESLCVLEKLSNIWVFVDPPPLSLETEKFFQWVLSQPSAQERGDLRQ